MPTTELLQNLFYPIEKIWEGEKHFAGKNNTTATFTNEDLNGEPATQYTFLAMEIGYKRETAVCRVFPILSSRTVTQVVNLRNNGGLASHAIQILPYRYKYEKKYELGELHPPGVTTYTVYVNEIVLKNSWIEGNLNTMYNHNKNLLIKSGSSSLSTISSGSSDLVIYSLYGIKANLVDTSWSTTIPPGAIDNSGDLIIGNPDLPIELS